jgi:hypothetical protein
MPYHGLASYPGSVSATAGTSGTARKRCALLTAIAFSVPPRTCGAEVPKPSKATPILPATMSFSSGELPR